MTLSYGGLACTVEDRENLTGLDIQFAGLITFDGVIAMSNAVGGVDGLHRRARSTTRTPASTCRPRAPTRSTGYDALAFLRSRHGVGDGSDLGRISSQQVFLSSLVRKIKSDDTLTDFGKLYGIAQAATQNMTLSENFASLDTLVSIALVLKNIPLENIVFVQYPGTTGGTGIYAGKVQPITVGRRTRSSTRSGPTSRSASTRAPAAARGSVLDPNATRRRSSPRRRSTRRRRPTRARPRRPAPAPPVVIPGLRARRRRSTPAPSATDAGPAGPRGARLVRL